MSKWEKLLEKIRNNPKGVTFEEVDKVLRSMGYVPRQPRGGSSHYKAIVPVLPKAKLPLGLSTRREMLTRRLLVSYRSHL